MPNPVLRMIQEQVSLLPFNTLRLDVNARYFAAVQSVSELERLLKDPRVAENAILVLGGGSNILLSKDFDGVVLKLEISGRSVVYEDDEVVDLALGAGEDWPSVVEFAVANGWGGIENLALVPGTAGAAPVHNIACYGHNLHESLLWVESIDLNSGALCRFRVDECGLGYRTSIFKQELKGRHIVVRICLRLRKRPMLNTSYQSRYESVAGELERLGPPPYGVREVFNAIVSIRQRKLPDPARVGTVGSVFMNPTVTVKQLQAIKALCPEIQYYPAEQLVYGAFAVDQDCETERVKIPAAWLIEDMGWAGKQVGHCGVWKTQPLNIVNYGGATPREYLDFLQTVQDAVYQRYGVRLDPEVVVI